MKIKVHLKGVLFDLDGTLLDIDLYKFLAFYAFHLHKYFPNSMPYKQWAKHMLTCSLKTLKNNSNKTNLDVFMDEFLSPLKLTREECEQILKMYYQNEYHELKKYVKLRPQSREVVQHFIKNKFKVVLATNPVYMIDAIKARMKWAGISDLQFDLITRAEIFKTCKPNLTYFKDIFSKIGLNAKDCLVVGDEDHDMIAKSLGCQTFLIKSKMTNLKEHTPKPDFVGNLNDLMKLI